MSRLSPFISFIVGLLPALLLVGARERAAPLLLLPLIALCWTGAGSVLCRLIRVEACLALCAGLGAGLCNTWMYFGGLAGLWRFPLVAWFPLLFLPAGLGAVARGLGNASPISSVTALLRGLLGLAAGLLVLVLCIPPIDPDAMTYHLALPELWAVKGRFVFVPTLHYSYLPLLAEQGLTMARLWLIALPERAVTLAQGMGLLHGLLLARGAAGLVRACGAASATAEELAALLVFLVPATLLVSGLPYNDAFGAAMALMALAQALAWSNEPSRGRAIVTGLLIGFAMGAKHTLMIVPLVVAVAAIVASPRRHAWTTWIRGSLVVGAAAAAVWLPWTLSTMLATGNPFYPFAFELLGGAPHGLAVWDATAALQNHVDSGLGAGWNPLDWILAPVELWTRPLDFGLLPRVGPNLLLGVPFILWTFRPAAERRERALAVAAGLLYIFWSVSARNARFLIPALAVALAVAALGLTRASAGRSALRLTAIALVTAILTWDVTRGTEVFRTLLDPAAVLSGAQSAEAYVASRRRPREAFAWIAANLPGEAKILLLGETRSLGLERDRIVGGSLDPSPLLWLERLTGATGFIDAVRRSDATHVLVDPVGLERLSAERDRYRGRVKEARALIGWLDRETKLLFRARGVSVYEVQRGPVDGGRLSP